MKVLGIASIGNVRAHSSTRDFYQDLLSLDLLENDEGYEYYGVGATTRLEILAPETPSARLQRPDSPAIGFLVDDLDDAVHRLERAGLVNDPPIHEWRSGADWHRWIYLKDPELNVLLLVERR